MARHRCGDRVAGRHGRRVPHCLPASPGQTGLPGDLAAIIPDTDGMYADLVNDFMAVEASPELMQADERQAQWRPDGRCATFIPRVTYEEPLPLDCTAARHFTDDGPPVPAWDALALTSATRNRHVVNVLRANLPKGDRAGRPGTFARAHVVTVTEISSVRQECAAAVRARRAASHCRTSPMGRAAGRR